MENKEDILKETSIPETFDKNTSLSSPPLKDDLITSNPSVEKNVIMEVGRNCQKIENLEKDKIALENRLQQIENDLYKFKENRKNEKKYIFKIHAILLVFNIFLIILSIYSYFIIFDKVLDSIFNIIEKENFLESIKNNWLKLSILFIFIIIPSAVIKDIFLGLPQFYNDFKNMFEKEE
mgnify:CR=1 FL=1